MPPLLPRLRLPLLLIGAMTLGACATYAPSPLPLTPAPVPEPATLSREGSALRHPRLAPLPIDLSRPMTPRAIGVLAVVTSPELKAARAKAGVARAQAFAARLLPDPVISLGIDKPISGPDTLTALSAAIGFDTSSLYLAPVARAEADRATEQARLDLAWQEWAVAEQASTLAARIVGLAWQSALANDARAIADDLLARTSRAAERGDLARADLDIRRIASADAGERARTLQRDLTVARADLNKLLGLPPDMPLAIVTAADAPPPLDAAALFARAQDRRLDLAALRAGYGSQDAKLRRAILEQYPKIDLTVTRARDTAGVNTIGPAAAFTLPLWNRNRGAIAIETATREHLRAEYVARLSDTRGDIASLVATLDIGRRQRADLLSQVEPIRRSARVMTAAAARGDLALSTVDAARQAVFDKELALAVIEQQLAEATIALELAVGSPLETW